MERLTPDHYLGAKFDLAEASWQPANLGTYTHTNSQAYYETPWDYGPMQFFQLQHIYSGFGPVDGPAGGD